ncbi:MAG: hypothetical protein K1X75_09025 [Leptospirales bacterium]|nr:hypothetical protein [Leptospirales bacterium]
MAFTEDDNCREILLKVLIAEAWRNGGPSDDDRDVIEDWIQALALEGPERSRVLGLLNRPVDDFQAQIYDGQLKAALSSHGGCQRMKAAQNRILGRRRRPFPLEIQLARHIEEMLRDRSGIQLLVEDAQSAQPTASAAQ